MINIKDLRIGTQLRIIGHTKEIDEYSARFNTILLPVNSIVSISGYDSLNGKNCYTKNCPDKCIYIENVKEISLTYKCVACFYKFETIDKKKVIQR
jgi:hypothetical protein